MSENVKIRGVNLGGWLILEKWMTPSLFVGTAAVDEFTLMQTSGAKEKIERHRKTFVTEADFQWLKKNGVNAVRIPIGYWIFDGDGPFTPAVSYLDWAIQMAEKYELKVLIDLHGAKGSQNGKDHSGQIGKNEWHKHKEYRQQTVDTLEKVARRYYAAKSVWGIELINEPKSGIVQWKLRWFYKRAYDRLRRVARPGTVIVFHDAFMPRLLSGALGSDPNFPIVMDVHWYQFGSKWRQREKLADYFTRIQRRAGLLVKLQRKQPVIIGEWSMVLTQGVLAGRSRQDAEVAYRQHGVLQMKTYDFALGWFYWSYKTEERNVWNFRALIEDGRSSLK